MKSMSERPFQAQVFRQQAIYLCMPCFNRFGWKIGKPIMNRELIPHGASTPHSSNQDRNYGDRAVWRDQEKNLGRGPADVTGDGLDLRDDFP